MVKLNLKKLIPSKNKEATKGVKKNISKPEVQIIVKRLMGDTPVTIAEFMALQDKDSDMNLKLVNGDYDFKEDTTVVQNKLIDLLNYKLDLKNKTREEKVKIVQAKINEQEALIKDMKEGKYLAVDKYEEEPDEDSSLTDKKVEVTKNILDEDYRLCTFKALLFIVKNEDKGSYEEINKDGYRQISYLYNDGVLIPYFHASTTVTLYPDVGAKRKLHKDRQDMIEQDYLEENKGAMSGWFLSFMKILFIVLLLFNMYWSMDLVKDRAEFASFMDSSEFGKILEKAEMSSIKCGEYLTSQYNTNEELIAFAKTFLSNTTDNYLNDGNTISLE